MKSKDKFISKLNLDFLDAVILICIGVIAAIVPVVVRFAKTDMSVEEAVIRTDTYTFDAFSYYKSNLLVIAVAIMLIVVISGLFVGDSKFNVKNYYKNPIYICTAVYMLFVVLSTVFSSYKITAVSGISQRYESIYVLLAYMVTMIAVLYFVKDIVRAKTVLWLIVASALIIGIIGTFQTFGIDPFNTDLGQRIALGKYYEAGKSELSIEFVTTYATLYNPNCVGLYTALLTPVFFITALFTGKKTVLRYTLFAVSILMFISLIGSESEAGYIGFIAGALVIIAVGAIYTMRFASKRSSKIIYMGSIIGVTVIAVAVIAVNFSYISARAVQILNLDGNKVRSYVEDMRFIDNTVTVDTADGSFIVRASEDDERFFVTDTNGNIVEPNTIDIGEHVNTYNYDIGGAGSFTLKTENRLGLLTVRSMNIYLYADEDGNLYPLTKNKDFIDIHKEIPSIGFKNMQSIATGRGYIWSKSLPVMLSHIIIGSGPDSFLYEFPQHDVIGKLKYLGDPYTIVDKPHNTYLQIGINTGCISLIALIVLFAYCVISLLISLLKERYTDKFMFGLSLGLLGGVCGYLVCSLSTDSTVSVSPVFYCIIGLAFGLIKIIEKSRIESGTNESI